MAAKNNNKENSFESRAEVQWNKNRERFYQTMDALVEIGKLFGLVINPMDGKVLSFDANNALLRLPSSNVQEQPVIDFNVIADEIADCLAKKQKEKPISVIAKLDDSIHIANNKALMESFRELWIIIFEDMLKKTNIIREISEDNTVIYKFDKNNTCQRLVDKEEKNRQEFEKKPSIVKMFLALVNTVKRIAIFYILSASLVLMSVWNMYLHYEVRELELTKKEYLILRWHSNAIPESKQFLDQLDSLVNKEGVSPVYGRGVNQIKKNSNNKK